MSRFIRIMIISAGVLLFSVPAFAAPPVVMLIQARGTVAYSPDGAVWEPVRRNKFLYDGWIVKTGENGSCRLLIQKTGQVEAVGGSTRVRIRAAGSEILTGKLTDAEPAGSLMGFLQRKFAKIQKYTAVQRSAETGSDIKLKTVGKICLSAEYPDLVWENIGMDYTYRVMVGDTVRDVPKSCEALVRCRLEPLPDGDHPYCVQVRYEGVTLYAPEEKGTLHWVSDEKMKQFQADAARIEKIDPDNGFLMGNLLDEYGFKVAAMDQYRRFLSENPDAAEVRLFLAGIYDDLELTGRSRAERLLYQQSSRP